MYLLSVLHHSASFVFSDIFCIHLPGGFETVVVMCNENLHSLGLSSNLQTNFKNTWSNLDVALIWAARHKTPPWACLPMC